MAAADYIRVTTEDPHVARGRQLLAAHPELRELAGPMPSSLAWILVCVSAQIATAVALGSQPCYVWLAVAYVVGATIDHALWVLIHECAHNLILPTRLGNRLAALTANLPLVFPAAMSFCKYHLLHHRHIGNLDLDADLAGPDESRAVGDSRWAKAAWLTGFVVVLAAVRPRRLKSVRLLDAWSLLNVAVQGAAVVALLIAAGWRPLAYLLASSVLAVGLHPLGARWIQEHYVFAPGQETYSYYGPLNRLAFNVGYHNEHHDLVSVPWAKLPQVRAAAPEFYESLYAHQSWTGLMLQFLHDRRVTLFSRIVR